MTDSPTADRTIELVPVTALRMKEDAPREFYVPAYQRGYRWTRTQVTQLLEDIFEFVRRPNPHHEDFYCLQPLVLKEQHGRLEVVDGQQRLTTLYLLLRHFNNRQVEKYRMPLFRLVYETRPGLDAFLDQPLDAEGKRADDNADYHHFHEADQAIEAWFEERESYVEEIKTHLLTRTKAIWYQLSDADNPVEAFTRLNVGKIPLTNEELIRALFLRRPSGDAGELLSESLFRLAQEWDQIEKALQSPEFWGFLSNQPPPVANRIGLLFALAVEPGERSKPSADDYALFHQFSERLGTSRVSAERVWRDIKDIFLSLQEWFEDRTLLHLVGFLVADGMTIRALRAMSKGLAKSQFERALREEIFKRTFGAAATGASIEERAEIVDARLSELDYRSKSTEIRRVLLLFNVASLLSNPKSNIRFQFDSFKKQEWDIEHIRSVSDTPPGRHDEQKAWLSHCLAHLERCSGQEALVGEIKAFFELPATEESKVVFTALHQRLLANFGEAVALPAEHGLGNLTLLDSRTNRSYGNAVFAVKRMRVLDLDQAGIFVPLCTRNAFLKCYSPDVAHALRWTPSDQDGYRGAMARELKRFFGLSGVAP